MRIEIDEVCILKLRENGGFRRDARSEQRMLFFPLPPITLTGITFTQINKFAKFYYVSANGHVECVALITKFYNGYLI